MTEFFLDRNDPTRVAPRRCSIGKNLGEETFGGLFDETESAEVEIDFHTVRLGVAFRF